MSSYKTGSWGIQAKARASKRNEYKYWSNLYRERRLEVIKKLGGQCNRCGFDDFRALQVDHVNGGGHKETSKLSRWSYHKKVMENEDGKYQLLCANCNWIKRYENREMEERGED